MEMMGEWMIWKFPNIFSPYCSPVDMIADKTDNVEVVVALDGSPIDDEDDIGNE